MDAAILAVGTELLDVDRLDTNSLLLTRALQERGCRLLRKEVVGDHRERIARALVRLVEEHDLVLVTGGLGPTADDLTREALAEAFSLKLIPDTGIETAIEARFRELGRAMPTAVRRQAQVPTGAQPLLNSRGTAPGLRWSSGSATVFLFPGVPTELEAMIANALVPWLEGQAGATEVTRRLVVRVACLGESTVEELIAPVYAEFGSSAISILSRPGDVRIQARCSGEANAVETSLERMRQAILAALGHAAYSTVEDESLEAVVGHLLQGRGETVATAESCTGGLVAERLTRVAGSSAWFPGGGVAYSNAEKRRLFGITEEQLEQNGAVSQQVAVSLADSARRSFGADWGIGITGIAGPGGGTAEKPVGTVHIAISGPGGYGSHSETRFPGSRAPVRQLTSQFALDLLRRLLLDEES